MTRRARIFIVGGLVAAGAAGLFLAVVPPSAPPVDLAVMSVEASGIIDKDGQEFRLVTLLVRNHSAGEVELKPDARVEARAGGRWVPVQNDWGVHTLDSRGGRWANRIALVLLPDGAEGCRLHLRYEPWPPQWRAWMKLGSRGQRVLRWLPPLEKWMRPDAIKWSSAPRKRNWSEIAPEVSLR